MFAMNCSSNKNKKRKPVTMYFLVNELQRFSKSSKRLLHVFLHTSGKHTHLCDFYHRNVDACYMRTMCIEQ